MQSEEDAMDTWSLPMSHFEPSDTNISDGFRPALLYNFSQMAVLSSAFPCSAPYLYYNPSIIASFCVSMLWCIWKATHPQPFEPSVYICWRVC